MLQGGYIILIIGAALLISGIVISALWAGSFAGTFMRENTILSGVSIIPAGSVNTSTQVIDTSRPVSLAIHVERNNSPTGGQIIPNNILRETVRNPNGIVMTSNEFTKQVFITFKPGKGVGGFIFISNYVMPNIHQFCQSRLGALHCYTVQYHKIF